MKYLITQEQRELLLNALSLGELGYGRLGSMVESLKPIEPLNETDVFCNDKIMSHNYMPMSVMMELVRAIEAHILGETT